MNYMGDFLEDATVYIPFNTFDSNDPSASVTITDLVAGDVEVWKNGVVQTTPGAGVTVTLNIGTNNGTHLIAVDTSNTTDAGWFVTGADFQVRINGTTVDGATVNAWVGTFSIENRFKEVTVTSMAANVVTAAAIAAAAIDNATFAADVGSTAYATNIIALAVRKALDEINLDHLAKVDTTVAAAGDLTTYVVDGSILSHIISNSNTSDYNSSTDALQPIRDHIGNGTNLTEAGGDGDHLTAINLPNQTMDITGNITGNLSGSVGSVTGAVGSVAGNVDGSVASVTAGVTLGADAITAAKIADDAFSAEHFATDSITTVAVKSDALDKIVMSDLATGAPSATASLPVALNWVYEAFRNKTLTTATLVTIKKDDGSTDLAKATISDDATTFTKEEFVSG